MNTKPTSPLATKTLSRNKILVLFALVLWALMLVLGAACRSTAPEAPRTELAVAPGGCAPVAFPTIDTTLSVPPMDIKNGAAAATLQDAGVFAWQEFIALNWPALPQTGATNTRDQPDPSKPFGTTTGPLVWHTFRHKAEIFPGTGQPPGYPNSTASTYFGYDAPPQYIYANGAIPSFASLNGPTPTPTGSPSPAPWINLDEQSEIGLDTMFAGTAANLPFPHQQILFLAKANRAEYMYIAANKWWDGTAPGGLTAKYIANFAKDASGYVEPAPGNTTGPGPSPYVSFPNNVIEIKSAWRQLTPKEASSGRFYTTTVRYYNSKGSQVGYIDAQNNPSQGYPVWGLVALHIIQKTPTAPYFIYATFSQADNLLDSSGKCIEDEEGNLRLGPCGEKTTATPAPTAPLEPNVTSTPATSASPPTPQSVQHLAPQEVSPLTLQTTGQRLFYSNTAPTPTPTPTPTPATTQGIIAVNQRQHNIPQCIIDVNTSAHAAIKTYGQQNNNGNPVWLYYKLINVQYQPYDKTPGIVYTGTSPDPSTYYQANEVVETNFILQVFSGQFQSALPAPYANINTFGLITDYNTDGTTFKNVYYNLPAIVPNPSPSPTPSPTSGKAALMGGCMGCHGNAQVAGYDFSFILRNGRVTEPDVAAGAPNAANPAGVAKFRKLLLGK